MKLDFVWPLGTGSKVHDRELGCSMRSVAHRCRDVGEFFVIGSRPQENPRVNFTHIQADDLSKWFHLNTYRKVLRACSNPAISPKFVWMNDDFFVNSTMLTAWDIQNCTSGSLRDHIERNCDEPNHYTLALQDTYNQLKDYGLPTYDFEVHTPMVIDKELFTQRMGPFKFDESSGVVPLWRSLYGNSVPGPHTSVLDCKLDWPMNDAEIERQIAGRRFFSVGDGAVTTPGSTVLEYLERTYP